MRKKVSPGSLTVQPEAAALHEPVLPAEVLEFLNPAAGVFVDATLGLGGHSEAILRFSDRTRIVGIDKDSAALGKAAERLESFGSRLRLFQADFREIKTVLAEANETGANGVLADLGVSSWQLDDPRRGFSFRFDAPLDMRMNAGGDEATAAELLATLGETEIADLIYQYGEERFSRRIARRIVERRERGEPVETTRELAGLVERAVKTGKHERIHPATKTFQALRIAVNGELEDLDKFIADAIDVLQPNGRLVVISFHSLEDRIVKQTFRQLAGRCVCPPRLPVCQCGARRKVEILTARPVTATETEMQRNPRARSAKLRACRKLTIEEV